MLQVSLVRVVVQNENAMLGMVGIVGTHIILKGVDRVVSDRPNGTPEQIPKVNNEVRRNIVDRLVDLFWLEDLCWNLISIRVCDRHYFFSQGIADRFII